MTAVEANRWRHKDGTHTAEFNELQRRNRTIFVSWLSGDSYASIGRRHARSGGRVKDIVWNEISRLGLHGARGCDLSGLEGVALRTAILTFMGALEADRRWAQESAVQAVRTAMAEEADATDERRIARRVIRLALSSLDLEPR